MYRVRLLWSRSRLAALGAALFGAVVLVAGAAGQAAKDVPRDEHGAASVKHQMQVLDKLMPPRNLDEAPPGIDPVAWKALIPKDNALTPKRVALGKRLYFDKRLSSDGSVSCATCHDVTRGLTDQRATSEGVGKRLGKRNAPTTFNVVLLHTQFLDGRSPNLEHQAKMPILNPVEMAMPDEESALKAIKDDPEYQKAFREAYGRDVNY